MVCMRAFRQACRRCPNPQLEEPEFSLETTERLLHNLVLKILEYCYGVHIQPSNLLEVVVHWWRGRTTVPAARGASSAFAARQNWPRCQMPGSP